jgi:Ca-activated chloride channel homolog
LLCLAVELVSAQYYFRGEVKDETNNPLANARILLHSTGYIYYSGNSGGFGIISTQPRDSLTIMVEGYQQACALVEDSRYASITLKILSGSSNPHRTRLISLTKDMRWQERHDWAIGRETYSTLVENDFIPARKFPETGFAINTDLASYSNVRRFINMNSHVPPDAVRIEELLNYFNFGYREPGGDSVFSFHSYLSSCPWNPRNQLLFLKVCARKLDLDTVPPGNLVFLIDISGSMDMPNRLPLLKSAFKLMVNNLRDKDTVSIVVYGSTVGVWLQPTSGKEKEKISKAIEDLYPGGPTPGASGIATAYQLAKSKYIRGGNNRVILATDGDFNVGERSEEDLERMITMYKQWGIYLTCLGVGMGNYKDSKLEILAKKGNGNFAYLDNEKEAEKVLVKELTRTLYSVADDAFLSIRFDPSKVRDYRLIGFDNKVNAVSDSLSELEGGEVGSGHTLTALCEISPASPDALIENNDNQNLASVTLNYRYPRQSSHQQIRFDVPMYFTEFSDLPACQRFAAAVAEFGSMLKDSKFVKDISWTDAINLAAESVDLEDPLQKEFLGIVQKAKKIYGKRKHH